MKAVKNPTEIAGARAAHVRDGAAVARFLAWFDREAPRGKLTEIDAVEALESFRRDTGLLKDISFPDHRRRRAGRRDRALPRHHQDQPHDRAGRTVPDRFRRPIRGRHHRHHPHDRGRRADAPRCATASPACSRATSRSRARCFPTAPPARSSIRSRASSCGRRASTSTTAPATASAAICRCTKGRHASPSSDAAALKRGMILSNEPGYYKAGAYGIRIENLVLVVEADRESPARRSRSTRFETLTLAPIDRRLVDGRDADARGDRLARRAITRASPNAVAAGRRRDPRTGSRPRPARSGAR